MGTFCDSGLVIDVVTIATVGGRGDRTEAGRAGVAAAFSTRGRVFVVRTGVTVSVCGETIQFTRQSRTTVVTINQLIKQSIMSLSPLIGGLGDVNSRHYHQRSCDLVPAAVLQVSAGSAAGWLA